MIAEEVHEIDLRASSIENEVEELSRGVISRISRIQKKMAEELHHFISDSVMNTLSKDNKTAAIQ